jgi:hypothetical protein
MPSSQIERMISKLRSFQNLEKTIKLTKGLFISLAVVNILFILFVGIEFLLDADSETRTILFAAFVVLSIIAGSFAFINPLFKYLIKPKESLDKVALRVGRNYDEINDSISNAVQLYSALSVNGDRGSMSIASKRSPDLILAGINQNIEPYLTYDFKKLIDKKSLLIAFALFVSSIMIYSVGMYAVDGMQFARERLVNYNAAYLPSPNFDIVLNDVPTDVESNTSVDIIIEFEGVVPSNAYIYQKTGSGTGFIQTSLLIDPNGIASFRTLPLRDDYSFYIAVPWYGSEIKSDIYDINVLNIPKLTQLSGTIVSPDYTKLPAGQFDNSNPDIIALTGSAAMFDITANTDLSKAELVFQNDSSSKISNTIALDTEGNKAFGRLNLMRDGRYSIKLTSEDGMIGDTTQFYDIQLFDDAYPTVNAFLQSGKLEIDDSGITMIEGIINDDFGFTSLRLFYKLLKSDYTEADKQYRSLPITIETRDVEQEFVYLWDLNTIGISPSDEYEFYIEVADNDRLNGFKKSKTQTFKAKLLSLEELLAGAERKQEDIKKELSEAIKESQKIKDRIEDLKQDLRADAKKKEMTFEQKKKAKEIAEKQNQLNEKLAQLQKDLADNTQKMKENNLLSKETLKEFQELQKLMQQIKDPNLEKLSEKINQELEKMTPDQMRKMLEKNEFSEQQFRESIKRTMERLKKLENARKADALQKKAEHLAEQQKDLAKSQDEQKSAEQTQKDIDKQKALKKKLDELEKQAQELKEQLAKDDPKTNDMFETAMQKLDKDGTNQKMAEAEQQMQKGDKNKAQQNQQQAARNMEDFASQMQQMNQQMSQQNKEQVMKDMQKQLQNALDISKKQEALKNQTQKQNGNSSKLPDINNQQGQLKESLRNLAKQMQQLSEETSSLSPEMGKKLGEAQQEMQQANDQLSERRPTQASKNQENAMSALNDMAAQMQSALGKMQGGQGNGKGSPGGDNPMGQQGQAPGGQGGFSQQLQQAAAQQQMLNQAMQQMGAGGSKPGQMNDQQKAEYGRLQNQQGSAKKTIDEMIEEEKKSQSPNKERLKNLESLAKDMQEVQDELADGNVSERTVEKQQKILTRMLDAIRTENKRDISKKREGKQGKDYYSDISEEELERLRREALQDMIRRDRRKFKKDYEQIIRKYYENIEGK